MKRSDVCDQDIIDACNAFHSGIAETPDIALSTKYPKKLILSKMEQMVEKGILNYVVSLRTAWVISK
jgi:hypothetical protein